MPSKSAKTAAASGKQTSTTCSTPKPKKSPHGSEGLFFLPYLAGERTPHADPLARGCFVGLTLSHTRGHLARSVMEGATYALRDSLAIIRELGVPVKEIRASGGGSKSPLWRQIQADVFGQDVVTINAEQGPAYGVALLAAVGSGAFKNIEEACAATIRVVSRTPCDKKAAKIYDRGFPDLSAALPVAEGGFSGDWRSCSAAAAIASVTTGSCRSAWRSILT